MHRVTFARRGGFFIALFLFLPACAAQTAPNAEPTTQARRVWVNPQPGVPYLPLPATRPADWLVEHDPVSPDASPEARALLKYLYSISGHHTLTGQHNFPGDQEYSTQLTARTARKTPVIYGTDWGFSKEGDKDSAYVRGANVQEMIKQYQAGSIIALCWHEVRPTDNEPVTFRGSVQGKLTNAQFNDVITPGTLLYQRWCAQVDVIAGYLKQLQDAHVPVLFRPYHEMNGDWFWWGGRRGERGTKQVYRQLFDRFTRVHHLTNLIWVWNCDQPVREDRQFVDYFPGQQYMDVLALDDYGVFQQRFYDEMNALSDGKVLAIAETFNPPPIDIYRTQPKWAYWMRWAIGRRPQRGFGRGGGFRPRTPTVPLSVIVSAPRMFSLQDAAYWDSIAPLRQASGLPPGEPIPVPPPPPATQPTSR